MSLLTSTRSSVLPVTPEVAWHVLASGRPGPHWYVDTAPFLFRAALDRITGGHRLVRPPDRDLLMAGDRVGFWHVTSAEPTADGFSLELDAVVRAPGAVTMRTVVAEAGGGCRLTQSVTFRPRGLTGTAYLLADLPARETLLTLVHHRACHDITAR